LWPEKNQFSMPPLDRRSSRKVAGPLKQEQRKFDNTIVRTPRRPSHPAASFSEDDLALARAEAQASTVKVPPSQGEGALGWWNETGENSNLPSASARSSR
jgi:hypothetical protein